MISMAYLEQLKELYRRLSVRQRVLIAIASLLMLALVLGLAHWHTERNFKPLFQDLPPEDAALVISKLKESAVEVRLENNGRVVKVPADKVDELRIQMAAAGLPQKGRFGFELFDKPNFGTSEFAEQVNYHRAVEGELERSVMSLQEVDSARIHITFPRQSLFLENRQPAKASVLLKLKPGASLSKQNVQAISHLASSAVDGLAPENVSVLDMRGNLLSRAGDAAEADGDGSRRLIEFREKMERDLREKIQATLEPLFGSEGFRTAVSLDCDMASGDQSEETFDPSRSVMVNSQRSEDGTALPSAQGLPGTSSNLPRPSPRPGGGSGNPLFRRSEAATFQTSRVIRHIKFPQGQVKRLSVSVLLDHSMREEGGKTTLLPPSPERVRAVRDLVSGIVGFQQERGDQLIVEAIPFDSAHSVRQAQPEAVVPSRPRVSLPQAIPDWLRVPLEGHLDWLVGRSWLPALLVALAALLLLAAYVTIRAVGARVHAAGSFLAAKVRRRQRVVPAEDAGMLGPAGTTLLAAPDLPHGAGKPLDVQLRERAQEFERKAQTAVLNLELPAREVTRTEVLARHLSEFAQRDPEAVASLLRAWTESGEAGK